MSKATTGSVTEIGDVGTSSAHNLPPNLRVQQDALNKPFDTSKIKQVDQRGKSLDYIPVAEVVSRMNEVLGTGNWSDHITDSYIFTEEKVDSVVVKVTVMAVVDGKECSRDGIGGSAIKRLAGGKNMGQPVNLGDDFKSAYSDAFKKACQHFGVGLHLALPEEEGVASPVYDPEVSFEDWNNFLDIYGSLDKNGQAAIKERWAIHSAGKPSRDSITQKQFSDLMAWTMAQSMSATAIGSEDKPF